jgi:hypothetical protein
MPTPLCARVVEVTHTLTQRVDAITTGAVSECSRSGTEHSEVAPVAVARLGVAGGRCAPRDPKEPFSTKKRGVPRPDKLPANRCTSETNLRPVFTWGQKLWDELWATPPKLCPKLESFGPSPGPKPVQSLCLDGQVRPGRCRRRGVSPDPPRGVCARAVRAERRAGRACSRGRRDRAAAAQSSRHLHGAALHADERRG